MRGERRIQVADHELVGVAVFADEDVAVEAATLVFGVEQANLAAIALGEPPGHLERRVGLAGTRYASDAYNEARAFAGCWADIQNAHLAIPFALAIVASKRLASAALTSAFSVLSSVFFARCSAS
ncbi:hypothetical protein D3C76_1515950 [compost metagenome]